MSTATPLETFRAALRGSLLRAGDPDYDQARRLYNGMNAGPTLWELEHSAAVLRWYREFITAAPESLNGFFAFLSVPPGPPFPEHLHNRKMCGVVWCHNGPEPEAEKLLAAVREPAEPALHGVQPMPYPVLRRRSRPGQCRPDHPLDQGLLGRAAPVLGRRCLRELHHGRRGPGSGQGHLPRQP